MIRAILSRLPGAGSGPRKPVGTRLALCLDLPPQLSSAVRALSPPLSLYAR
jgi:hypothetical protein